MELGPAMYRVSSGGESGGGRSGNWDWSSGLEDGHCLHGGFLSYHGWRLLMPENSSLRDLKSSACTA